MRQLLRLLAALTVVSALLAPTLGASASANAPGTKHWAAGAYIVALNDGVSVDDVANQRVTSRGGYVSQRYHAALTGFAADLSEAEVNDLAADSRVESIMPDFAVHASTQTTPTGIQRIQALTSPLAQIDGVDLRVDVDVAVLDTGSGPHSDLNIAGGYNCTSTNTSAYNDNHGHGTHVAGTIGALDNGSGVVGVAPGARIWSIKVLDANGNGTGSQILCGIDWVKQHASTIEVANMSLGGSTTMQDDHNCGNTNGDSIHKAICGAVAAGVTFAVAAGNDGKDSAGYFPAQYDEVITVSALDDTDGKAGGLGQSNNYGADDTLASFSNYGADVDVIAPGVSIYSTYLNNGYGSMSGTSMATPHVTGAVALYKAGHPTATPAQIRAALLSTGSNAGWSGDKDSSKEPLIDVSTFAASGTGGGATHDAAVSGVSATASVTQGAAATVSATVSNNGSATETITVNFSEAPGGATQSKSVSIGAGASSAVSFSWATTTGTTLGAHTFTVSAVVASDSNAANNSGTASTTVNAATSTGSGMSVSNMTLTKTNVTGGYKLTSTVYVKLNGATVAGAKVTVKFTYPNGSTVTLSATTNTSGYATFARTTTLKGLYRVDVTGVSKTGQTYNPAGNVISSKSLTVS
jgi:subtilisin